MKRKTPLSENKRRMHSGSRPRETVIVGLTLLLIATSTMLAMRGNSSVLNRQKVSQPQSEIASPDSLTPGSPSKEYVYAGGRLIATEEPCSISISPTVKFFTWSGGDGGVNVTASSGCTWTAVPSANWIIITSQMPGVGSDVFTYELKENFAATRNGTITIGSQVFTITQGGYGCTYPIAPTLQSFPHSGGDGMATVTTASGCGWIAVSNDSWITIISGSSGSGNGTVTYTVPPNLTGATRVGTISIANSTLTVKQKP